MPHTKWSKIKKTPEFKNLYDLYEWGFAKGLTMKELGELAKQVASKPETEPTLLHSHHTVTKPITAGSEMTIYIDGVEIKGFKITSVEMHQSVAGPTTITVHGAITNYQLMSMPAPPYTYADGATYFNTTGSNTTFHKQFPFKGGATGETKAPKQLPDLSAISKGLEALK